MPAETAAPTDQPPGETTTAPEAAPTLQWTAPPTEAVTFGPYKVGKCEGDAPLVCVSAEGARLGAVEYLTFPLDTLPDIAAALETGGVEAALQTHAAAYLTALLEDRTAGCPDFVFTASGPTTVPFAGLPGITYGFSGIAEDGTEVERVVQFATIDGGTLHIVHAAALEPGRACLEPLGEFTPAALDAFEPYLAALVGASRLHG